MDTVEGRVLDPTLQSPGFGGPPPPVHNGNLDDASQPHAPNPVAGAVTSGPPFDSMSAFAAMDSNGPMSFSPQGLSINSSHAQEALTLETGPLSDVVVSELCSVWFQSYHRWFPILHEPTFTQILQDAPRLSQCSRRLVVHAIVAVTIPHSQHLPQDTKLRKLWQESLEANVVTNSMNAATLESLQALLILSVLSCGDGRIAQASNVFAMCRR